jgi:hypothetical protein
LSAHRVDLESTLPNQGGKDVFVVSGADFRAEQFAQWSGFVIHAPDVGTAG